MLGTGPNLSSATATIHNSGRLHAEGWKSRTTSSDGRSLCTVRIPARLPTAMRKRRTCSSCEQALRARSQATHLPCHQESTDTEFRQRSAGIPASPRPEVGAHARSVWLKMRNYRGRDDHLHTPKSGLHLAFQTLPASTDRNKPDVNCDTVPDQRSADLP